MSDESVEVRLGVRVCEGSKSVSFESWTESGEAEFGEIEVVGCRGYEVRVTKVHRSKPDGLDYKIFGESNAGCSLH